MSGKEVQLLVVLFIYDIESPHSRYSFSSKSATISSKNMPNLDVFMKYNGRPGEGENISRAGKHGSR